MEEIWKDIEGFEGYYQVSNLGRVRSVERIGCNNRYYDSIIRKQSLSRGYPIVSLSKDGNKIHRYVHILVARAFVPNPNNFPQVGHKDETRTNNRADNLEWVTAKQNNNMPLHIKRISGENNSNYGVVMTQEQKDKISATKKSSGVAKGKNNPMYGVHRYLGEAPCAKQVSCEDRTYSCVKECWIHYNEIGLCERKYKTMCYWLSNPDKMPKEWQDRGLRYK